MSNVVKIETASGYRCKWCLQWRTRKKHECSTDAVRAHINVLQRENRHLRGSIRKYVAELDSVANEVSVLAADLSHAGAGFGGDR